jgi:hypothetical protein
MAEKTKLRRRILTLVGGDSGRIADYYCSRLAEKTDEFGSKREIRRELEVIIRERLIVETKVVANGTTYNNLSLPVYRLAGRIVTIRQMAASPSNRHGFTFDTIRKRLHEGLTPEQALMIPPVGRGKLAAAVDEFESQKRNIRDEIF